MSSDVCGPVDGTDYHSAHSISISEQEVQFEYCSSGTASEIVINPNEPLIVPSTAVTSFSTLLTAYDVFLSYVTIKDGQVDALGIFSPKCYEHWLSTRRGDIQHPEQTFHRTLLTHVRGSDRKPFPEDVEKEVLRLLRDPELNVWDMVFSSANKLHVGKYGFRHLGYHESKQQEINSEHDDLVAREYKGSSLCSSDDNIDNEQLFSNGISVKKQRKKWNRRNFSQISSLTGNKMPIEDIYHFDRFGRDSIRQIDCASMELLPDELEDLENEVLPWDRLSKIICQTARKSFMEELEIHANNLGMTLFPPALVFFMRQPFPKRSERGQLTNVLYDLSFIFPNDYAELGATTGLFLKKRMVGRVIFDLSKAVFIECSKEAKLLLGQDLTGKFFSVCIVSLLELWCGFIKMQPKLSAGKAVWKRGFLRKGDGAVGLFMMKFKVVSRGTCIQVELQDIADLHPELDNACFFV